MSTIAIKSTEFDEPITFIDGTPYFTPELDNLEKIAQHCLTLYDNRRLAHAEPISETWSFIAKIPALSLSAPPPNARPIPHFARHGGDFQFSMDIALQEVEEDITRNSFNCQVWVASVSTPEGFSTHPDETAFESVVLKIVQPSLLAPPETGREDPWSISPSARQLAFSEDWFYHRLSSCQGLQVPWYFGKFEVQLPNGEQAHVLIMEHVQGDTLEDLFNAYQDATERDKTEHLQRLRTIFSSIIATFEPLDNAKVFVNNVSLANIIIDGDDNAVVFGFANRRLCDDFETLQSAIKFNDRFATSQAECMVNGLLSLYLKASGGYASRFMEWASQGDAISKAWYSRMKLRARRT